MPVLKRSNDVVGGLSEVLFRKLVFFALATDNTIYRV